MTRGIKLAVVRLVAMKELRESLRDRRTLFVALLLPVLIYPIVLLGFAPLIGRQKAALATTEQAIAITGVDAGAVAKLVLTPPSPPIAVNPPGNQKEPESVALRVVPTTDGAADLASRKIALWVDVAPGFVNTLTAEGSARVRVHYDGSDDQSREAKAKWDLAFVAAATRALDQRLAKRSLDDAWRRPLIQEVEDVAPADRSAAYFYGKILALLLVLMTLTSSFYPAVDAVAGEKERGTMETLLVAPCGRTELVLGKFLAVCAVTLVAAILNLASLAFSTGPGLASLGGSKIPALSVTPGVVFGILLLLVPLAALFSAVALSLSTLARSIKEAQHYLSPLVMLVMPLAMAVTLPNLPLTPTLAAVPVTNAVLFFRDLLLSRTEWVTTTIVFTTTFGTAALAIWVCVLLFLREETLFRGPEGTGSLIARPSPREVPSAPSAVLLFASALAIMWYAMPFLDGKGQSPAHGLSVNVVVTQLAMVLAPCLLLALWLRVRPATTFQLGAGRSAWIAIALAVPLGIALPAVTSEAFRTLFGEMKPDGMFAEFAKQLDAAVSAMPSFQLVLLFGVLPAICEEMFFRGFVLSAFRAGFEGRGAAVRAVLATSACFALFHIFPERWFGTFVIGCLLGFLAVRTRSIWPGVVVHAMNNASSVLAEKHEPGTWLRVLHDPAETKHPQAVAAAFGAVIACLLFAYAATRRAGPTSEKR